MRVERIVLEHHGDVALFRRQVVDDALADADLAAGDVFQAGDHPQQGRFAAAGGADQHDEFAVADGDVDAMDDGCRAEGLAHVADCDRSHSLLPGRRGGPPHIFLCSSHQQQIIGLSPSEKQARLGALVGGTINAGR